MNQRVLVGSSATITELLLDGTGAIPATPPTSAEVTITNDAGDVLAAGATATATSNPSEFSIVIDSAMTAQLDTLTLTWSHASLGPTVTTVEVVGGLLFTVAELRAQADALASVTNYPTSRILAMRTRVEQALERRIGYALVPRFSREQVSGGSHITLKPYLRSIRSASSAGTAVDTSVLSYGPGGVVSGFQFAAPAEIAYEHGLAGTDDEAREKALMLAKAWLVNGPIDDRTTVLSSPDAGITQTLAVPGRGGSVFGIPSVDEFVQSARLPVAA